MDDWLSKRYTDALLRFPTTLEDIYSDEWERKEIITNTAFEFIVKLTHLNKDDGWMITGASFKTNPQEHKVTLAKRNLK